MKLQYWLYALGALLIFAGYASAEMKDRSKTDLIVIHHSATVQGNVDSFRQHHVKERGWDDVGYHFVITNGNGGPDGQVQIGRDMRKQGAHALGRNHRSVGICLVGTDTFTDKQKKSLVDVIVFVCWTYKIYPSWKTIEGHHEKCPGDGCDLGEVIRQAQKKLEETNAWLNRKK